MMMSAVPVISIGGSLNAIRYAMPTIVRHRVPDRVQRAAAPDHGHRAHHHRVLHLSLWTYGHPHDGRAAAAIDRSLEEASRGLGAGSGTTFRRVTLPLILPAFFAGLGVVFIRSMTAISATIFLVSIGWTLITVKILQDMTELALGPAAAFSVLVVVIVFAMIALIGRVLSLFRAQGAPRVTSMLGG